MTVDFPSTYPANTTPAASKPTDVQTLQEAFAAALRSYGTEKGGSQTNTMLEVLRANPSDGASDQDRNHQRRENQQQIDRGDFTQIDRKLLDKSEIRSSEMHVDYQNQRDRQEIVHNEYRERVDRSERHPSSVQPATPATSQSDFVRLNESQPKLDHSPPSQRNVLEIESARLQPIPASTVAPNSAASLGEVNLMLPMNLNAPASIPMTPQSVSTSAFTVFTPSGRFGQQQEPTDEKENENEDEESDENIVSKKKQQPFAVFEAVRVETMRPVHQKPSRLPKESGSMSVVSELIEKTTAKPKEVEPEQDRNVKTMADLLESPAQNVTAKKKVETTQSDQQQYLNRIAAACEAASHYAPIRLKINLDHLGTLSLRFFHKADKLTLRFESPSEKSSRFIRDNLDGLKTLLAKRNVKIDIELEVSM